MDLYMSYNVSWGRDLEECESVWGYRVDTQESEILI